ncbi:MAG: 4Fe-4S binding protein [Eubacteriales bacterium]
MGVFKIGKMIISSMFNKPATLMYPVIARVYTPITRGHIDIAMDGCIFCGICSKRCPTHAIVVEKPTKEWSIARLQCIQCNCCVEVCPTKCLTMANTYSPSVTERSMDTFVQAPKEDVPKAVVDATTDTPTA